METGGQTCRALMSRDDFIDSQYGSDRLAGGIVTFSKAMRMLLNRNDLTHEKLVELSKWCNPWGQTWLSTSQVSNLRTGQLKKAGPQTLDCLGQINLRLAELAGDRSPEVLNLPDFGLMPSNLRPPQPYFLKHAATGHPLDAGGLFMVWIGYWHPEGIGSSHVSDKEARQLSQNIERIVQSWARDKRLTLKDAMDIAIVAYGVDQKERQQKLKNVICGFDTYSGEELADELGALGDMLGLIDSEEVRADDVLTRLYRLPKD